MTGRALVLAAHGCTADPAMNRGINGLARRVARLTRFDEVAAAFHQGEPSLTTVLDGLASHDVLVVPLMTSAGYYSDTVLPRELAKNARYRRVRLRCTAPIGTSGRMADLVADRVRSLMEGLGGDPSASCLALVGHGTFRHPQSRVATVALAEELAGRGLCQSVLHAFLDEPPTVETIMARCDRPLLIVQPFLIGNGLHLTEDLTARLGVPAGTLPLMATQGPIRVIVDEAVGTDARMADVITAVIHDHAYSRQETG